MRPTNDYEIFFHDSYEKCREQFLFNVNALKTKYHLEHNSLPIPSKSDDNLFIDTVYLKTGENNENIAIISSGVHGVEGFTGSALQNILINKLLAEEKTLDGFDFLFIHAVNPWGFKNKRRVNENNVDLNRNFGVSEDLFSIKNEPYSSLNSILNPRKKLSRNGFSIASFTFKMLLQTIFKSKRFVVEAIGLGQYEFDKGIIFGGFNFQSERELLYPVIKKVVEGYKIVISLDLHTGLGKRGELYILNAPKSDAKTKKLSNLLFDDKVVSDDDEDFYNEHGAYLDFISSLCSSEQISVPVMFEYGTINTHTLLGGAKIAVNLRDENQGYHYGYRRKKDFRKIKKSFLEMLNPACDEWRRDISSSFVENFGLIQKNITKIIK